MKRILDNQKNNLIDKKVFVNFKKKIEIKGLKFYYTTSSLLAFFYYH